MLIIIMFTFLFSVSIFDMLHPIIAFQMLVIDTAVFLGLIILRKVGQCAFPDQLKKLIYLSA